MSYYNDYLQLVKKTPYFEQAECIAQKLASVGVRPERIEDASALIGRHFCNCDAPSVIYAIRAVVDGETLADIPSIAEVVPVPEPVPEPVPARVTALDNVEWPEGVTARHIAALHEAGMQTDQDIREYANQTPLEEIDGIGEKTAEKILSVIRS